MNGRNGFGPERTGQLKSAPKAKKKFETKRGYFLTTSKLLVLSCDLDVDENH